MSRPILVFGCSGQVAQEFAKLGEATSRAMVLAGRDVLDVGNHRAIDGLIASIAPAAVINAAAYTAVDRAESDADAAFTINRDAPAAMARACKARGLPLVHFSTDYVFDGVLDRPYVETDPAAPASVYGASKLAGEQAVLAEDGAAIILRTSWVYSALGSNFVKTMLRLAQDRETIDVVADQWGRPTWARDCATVAVRAVDLLAGSSNLSGVYHLAGKGDATRADLATATFEESARRGGPTALVRPITTADYPTPAKRPANSRLDCGKIEAAHIWRCAPWRESLATCIKQMEL